MLKMVIDRLKTFGYEATDADEVSLAFVISKVKQSIINQCNTLDIPDELQYIVVDMVCGEFLQTKYSSGQLDLENLDLGDALSSLSEGDISVSFDGSATDDALFGALVYGLINGGKDELLCYRSLRW